jgi:hypothetical protein
VSIALRPGSATLPQVQKINFASVATKAFFDEPDSDGKSMFRLDGIIQSIGTRSDSKY